MSRPQISWPPVCQSELLVPCVLKPSQGSLFLSLTGCYLSGTGGLPLPAPRDLPRCFWRERGRKETRFFRTKISVEYPSLILFYKFPNSLPSFLMLAFVSFAFSCFVLFSYLFVFILQKIQILKRVVFFKTQLPLFEVYHSSPLLFFTFLYTCF